MSTRSLRSTVAGAAGAPQVSGSGSTSVAKVAAAQDKDADKVKAGACAPKQLKKPKVIKQRTSKDELAPLQLFLAMPLDIFAAANQICTHLTTKDLLNLSITAKVFRKPLVAADSGPGIWAAQRRAAELPIFKNVSEIKFALLMHGEYCFACGTKGGDSAKSRVEMNLDFRTRLCFKCRKSMFVSKVRLRTIMPELHKEAGNCVISTHYSPKDSTSKPRKADDSHWFLRQCYLLQKDLEKVNEELMLLQEDDDETEGARDAAKLRRGTKSRRNIEFDTIDEMTKVEKFVAGKIAHLKTLAEETQVIRDAITQNKIRQREREVQEGRIRIAMRTARCSAMLSRAKEAMLARGWTDTMFTQALSTYSGRPLDDGKHEVLEDAEWTSLEPTVVAKLETAYAHFCRQEAHQTILDAQKARQDALTKRFEVLCAAASTEHKLTFPTTNTFLTLPEVTAVWEDTDSSIDDATWAGVLPVVQAAITSRRHEFRLEALRAILDSMGIASDTITIEVRDNLDSYPSAYLKRVTSLFQDSDGNLCSYPAVVARLGRKGKLAHGKTALGTRILRKILKAAGLSKAATVAQLNTLNPVLSFAEDSSRGKTYRWAELYYALYRTYELKEAHAVMTISLARRQ